MKGPVSTHREACLHQARVFLQQARAYRLRWLRDEREALGIPDSGWFFELLDWAAQRREQASYLPCSRWWRMPNGVAIFEPYTYSREGNIAEWWKTAPNGRTMRAMGRAA